MSARTALPTLTRRFAAVTGALVLGLGALTACGSTEEPAKESGPALTVDSAWVRATTGSKEPDMTSAFMVINNNTGKEVSVTGAASKVAHMTEIHDMVQIDGQMMMQKMTEPLVIKADSGVLLQPGGRHIMLMGLTQELAAGDEVTFTLTYGDGKSVEVTAPVKVGAEEGNHYHAPADGAGEGGMSGMDMSGE